MSAVIDLNAHALHAASGIELLSGPRHRPVAFDARGPLTLEAFEAEVRAVARLLPEATHAINLCDDRHAFLVSFCAAAIRGQTTLLPPSRAPAMVDEVRMEHPGAYCLGDAHLDPTPPGYLRLPQPLPSSSGASVRIELDALVAIGFTSGSTGAPTANPKTWRAFHTTTRQNVAALEGLLHAGTTTPVVATVPPQHMYGMELSVLLPLLADVAVHAARPFFPADVARALQDAFAPPLLVTTPVHLRALVEAARATGLAMPPLAGIVSATAPLAQAVAIDAEALFGCEVRELFGSTETCIVARRRTARDTAWTPLPGVRLVPQPDGTAVHAGYLPQPVVLADLIEMHTDGRFELRGRRSDLLEIAGKRASLGDLTRKLLAVPGVLDGVIVQLDANAHGVRRTAALVVAPHVTPGAVRRALQLSVDPAFLPRVLRMVAALPRNATGKLPRDAVLAMLAMPDAPP